MPTFEITLPDGRSVDVDAPDAQSAAKGAIQWAKGNQPSKRTKADIDAKRRVANTPNQLRAYTKGVSFGFADELDAAGAALETGATNMFRRATGKPIEYGMKDAYGAVMDANAQADNLFAREHPVQNVGLQVAGGISAPGAAAAGRYIGGARSLAGAVGRGAIVGGTGGAVAGAGNSRGVKGRAKGAASGGVTGAVVGGALPVAGRVAQTAGRAVNGALGQPFGGAQRGAAARLRQALQQDGLDENQINQAVQEWRASGVTPEFLNVAGENTRALIRAAGSQAGPARNAAQRYRDRTVSSIPNRAMERANTLTPDNAQTPAQYADELTTARRATADTDYAGFAGEQVNIDMGMAQALQGGPGRAAMQRARAGAESHMDDVQVAEIDRLMEGNFFEPISAGTMDRIRRAMGERGSSAYEGGRRDIGAGLLRREGMIDGGLDDVPGMDQARANYRGYSEGIEAATDGPSVMGPRSEFQPAQEAIQNNPRAVQGAQIRERQALRDTFGTRSQVRGKLRDINSAPDVRQNLYQLYGERGNQFADAAGNLGRKQDDANFIAPNTGPQTFNRAQDAQGFFGVVSNAMEVLGGSFRPVMERLARGLTMTERERNILVQIGIGTPEEAAQALQVAPTVSPRVTNLFRQTAPAISNTAASERVRSNQR